MTAVQYVEYILHNRWDKSDLNGNRNALDPIGDIESDAPIRTLRESPQDRRRENLSSHDSLLLRDGGITTIEPQSFGWVEERTVSKVTVDIRTTGLGGSLAGRERLWGERDGDNNGPSYGGLTGEVKRVCDEVRKGDQEFDLIFVTEMNDLSGEMGGQVWRATVEISLDVRATNINPNP